MCIRDSAQATFYDALFNQICQNGWTKNDKIDDNEYMQEMLKSGMLYISKVNDDGYYYQMCIRDRVQTLRR